MIKQLSLANASQQVTYGLVLKAPSLPVMFSPKTIEEGQSPLPYERLTIEMQQMEEIGGLLLDPADQLGNTVVAICEISLKNFPFVKNLTIWNRSEYDTGVPRILIIHTHPSIKLHSFVTNIRCQFVDQNNPRLFQHLSILRVPLAASLPDTMLMLRSVKKVDLSYCKGLRDVSSLSHVHTLSLKGCEQVEDVSMLGGVYSLNINDCVRILSINRLGKVKKLSIEGLTGLRDGLPADNKVKELWVDGDTYVRAGVSEFTDHNKRINIYSSMTGNLFILARPNASPPLPLYSHIPFAKVSISSMDLQSNCDLTGIRELVMEQCKLPAEFTPMVFPELRRLLLLKCEGVERIAFDRLPGLKVLKIDGCAELKNMIIEHEMEVLELLLQAQVVNLTIVAAVKTLIIRGNSSLRLLDVRAPIGDFRVTGLRNCQIFRSVSSINSRINTVKIYNLPLNILFTIRNFIFFPDSFQNNDQRAVTQQFFARSPLQYVDRYVSPVYWRNFVNANKRDFAEIKRLTVYYNLGSTVSSKLLGIDEASSSSGAFGFGQSSSRISSQDVEKIQNLTIANKNQQVSLRLGLKAPSLPTMFSPSSLNTGTHEEDQISFRVETLTIEMQEMERIGASSFNSGFVVHGGGFPFGNIGGFTFNGNAVGLFGDVTVPFGNGNGLFGNVDGSFGNDNVPFGNVDGLFGNDNVPFGNVSGSFGNVSGPFGNAGGNTPAICEISLQRFPFVKNLIIFNSNGYASQQTRIVKIHTHPSIQLHSLVTNIRCQFVDQNNPRLFQHLSICRLPGSLPDTMLMLRSVKKVDLSYCKGLRDVSSLSHVHTLSLKGCEQVEDVSMLGEVYSLNINDCVRILSINRLGKVKKLSIEGLTGLRDGLPADNKVKELWVDGDTYVRAGVSEFTDHNKRINIYSPMTGNLFILARPNASPPLPLYSHIPFAKVSISSMDLQSNCDLTGIRELVMEQCKLPAEFTPMVFPELRRLLLLKCEGVERIAFDRLPGLKVLKIDGCAELKNMIIEHEMEVLELSMQAQVVNLTIVAAVKTLIIRDTQTLKLLDVRAPVDASLVSGLKNCQILYH